MMLCPSRGVSINPLRFFNSLRWCVYSVERSDTRSYLSTWRMMCVVSSRIMVDERSSRCQKQRGVSYRIAIWSWISYFMLKLMCKSDRVSKGCVVFLLRGRDRIVFRHDPFVSTLTTFFLESPGTLNCPPVSQDEPSSLRPNWLKVAMSLSACLKGQL